MTQTSKEWYSDREIPELSILELAEWCEERKTKPKPHTLMTKKEMKERLSKDRTPLNALKLSLEKHERCLNPENWDTLRKGSLYGGTTCACCELFAGDRCKGCPLGSCNHGAWGAAREALVVSDRSVFEDRQRDLIDQIKKAIKDLEVPRYTSGQWFKGGSMHHQNFYVLANSGAGWVFVGEEGMFLLPPRKIEGPGVALGDFHSDLASCLEPVNMNLSVSPLK